MWRSTSFSRAHELIEAHELDELIKAWYLVPDEFDEVIKAHKLDEFVGYAGSFSATTTLDVGEYLMQ